MEKSAKHGKMDKTQKISLKQKIHRKWDFDKTEFQKQKTEKLWLYNNGQSQSCEKYTEAIFYVVYCYTYQNSHSGSA